MKTPSVNGDRRVEPDGYVAGYRRALVAMLAIVMIAFLITRPTASAQDEPEPAVNAADIQAVMNATETGDPPPVAEPTGIDMLSLITSGGRFMIPIGLMSLLVVTLAVERMLNLRRGKVIPKRLVRGLRELNEPVSKFHPPAAYELCLDHPSPTATVVASMALRTGQPLGEIERTASETIQREADHYAAPIRWLNLAAAATPLMGLLGTVWGMIVAFHESTSLSADRSRSEQLSEGIYTALVTTMAGLAVAIPAAILAQYLENRVAKLFHEMEEFAFELAPGLARFVGHRRLDPSGALVPIENLATGETPPPPPTTSVKGQPASGNTAKVH